MIQTGPYGVNTYIVGLKDQFCFITDPASCSFSGDENKITDFLEKNSLIPVAFVLTHGHFDHVAGIKILKEKYPEVPVLISEEDSFFLGTDNFLQQQTLEAIGFEMFIKSVENLPEPDAFLKDGIFLSAVVEKCSLQVKDELKKWKVIATPGHTKGSICLFNSQEKILLSGDTVFFHSYGRTDLPGGNESEIISSLRKIYSTLSGDTLCYCGHGETAFPLAENF